MIDKNRLSKHHLKSIRISLGLGKTDLSRMADVSVATINNIELKNHTPKPETMQKIVIALREHSGNAYETDQIFKLTESSKFE